MQHFSSIENVHLNGTWLSIGVFDGVHRGHQTILKQLAVGAQKANCTSTVVTFFPNPGVVLGKIAKAYYLTAPEQRAELIGEQGVENVITVEFTRDLSALSAQEFMHLLNRHLGLRHLIVGEDFALGHGREGNTTRLAEIGKEMGYDLTVISAVIENGERISSTKIRNLIQEGQVRQAAEMLGRYYSTAGSVDHGDGRGKSLGFPTANLNFWKEQLLPPAGVYATWAWSGNERFASVSNLGVRPTFDQPNPQPHLEAHLLDFDRDLYGKTVRLEFVERIRPEVKFSSVDELVAQVNHDKGTAREILGHDA